MDKRGYSILLGLLFLIVIGAICLLLLAIMSAQQKEAIAAREAEVHKIEGVEKVFIHGKNSYTLFYQTQPDGYQTETVYLWAQGAKTTFLTDVPTGEKMWAQWTGKEAEIHLHSLDNIQGTELTAEKAP